jgi:hypothetical protein
MLRIITPVELPQVEFVMMRLLITIGLPQESSVAVAKQESVGMKCSNATTPAVKKGSRKVMSIGSRTKKNGGLKDSYGRRNIKNTKAKSRATAKIQVAVRPSIMFFKKL